MQHGLAVAAEVDPDRPLTEEGRLAVARVARHAAACGVSIDRILHSGKSRAAQTAAILGAELGCAEVARVGGLKPNDPVDSVAAAVIDRDHPGSVALIGHLPSLERLASLLVAGDPGAHTVAMRNGGLVKLVPAAVGPRFSVAWIITPDVARD